MSQSSKEPHPVALFIGGSIVSTLTVLTLPVVSAGLLGWALHASGWAEQLTMIGWLMAVPPLYVLWMMIYLALSALEMQLLYYGYEKPSHHYTPDKGPEGQRHFRLAASYLRATTIRSLPLSDIIRYFPYVGKLFFLAYAPRCTIGKRCFFAGFMYDPDLTEIGDDVVIGGDAVLSSHSMVVKPGGSFSYVSAKIRLRDRSTIGGNARLALGVTVGENAIVEPMSNVTAMTTIPPGEVWGGNPAVFLRKRTDLPSPAASDESSMCAVPVEVRRLPADGDRAAAARKIVARALNASACSDDPITPATDQGEWDSLVQLAVAAALSDAYDCRLSPAQIMELRSIDDVKRCLAALADSEVPASVDLPSNPEWLPLLPPDEATRRLARASGAESSAGTPVRVVVAASFTAEPLASSLTLWGRAWGLAVEVEFCGYNQIIQALLDPAGPMSRGSSDARVVLLRLEDFPEHPAEARAGLEEVLAAIRQASKPGAGTLLVATLPPPLGTERSAERAAFDALRLWWSASLAELEEVRLLDFAGVVEGVGLAAAGDSALELAARAPYAPAVYRGLGIALARQLRAQRRPRAKVVALDADHTLWGGVLGEEGLDGIQIGADGPGRAFQAFQRALLRLKEQGVLLVLVSRNEESDVLDVLDRHPGMILRRHDFAAWRINWQPKSVNLRELADELNLGLDAFVFVDDDPAHRLEVEAALPQVHVFPFPDDPAQLAVQWSKLWLFDVERVTDEDRQRTSMIQQEQSRQRDMQAAGGLNGYLERLRLTVELREAEAADLPRVAQLTQKTNQFNVSLRRRTLDEVKQLADEYRLFVLQACDRFGDYGQIGAAIVRREPDAEGVVELDTLLVSCRALGRGVEEAFLHGLGELVRRAAATRLRACYSSGPRNQPARDFLERCGFQRLDDTAYELSLAAFPPLPGHVEFHVHAVDPQTT